MLGVLLSIVAGAAMSLQGVFNARLGEKIGLLESNMFVQGTAFVLSLAAMFVAGNGNLAALGQTNRLYWLGGALGLVITLTVMVGMQSLGPTVAVSVILIAQLLVAAVIDALGLFGVEQTAFVWTKYLGMALMIGGVLVFKLQL
ncbi:MAG: DMT family transporter [Christensenellales bacterium]|uniref:DMT family transporter n=1 Tax=Candidatus Avichristensenella intestinipullorum TaxID=2840693 RepID=A0A9D1CIR9_9FIRM|nr:DMT family transporter [Christensenellales bacterium]HIQ62628.1 DMT family transporter [Candidatus Avichristensenella intestinipullorum]